MSRARVAGSQETYTMRSGCMDATASSASRCTVTISEPASRNHGICTSGFAIMRWTSSGISATSFSCLTNGTPRVRFGTKCPSMTSTCTYPAPPSSIIAISRSMFMKSAESIEGAIFTGSNMPASFHRSHDCNVCPAEDGRVRPLSEKSHAACHRSTVCGAMSLPQAPCAHGAPAPKPPAVTPASLSSVRHGRMHRPAL